MVELAKVTKFHIGEKNVVIKFSDPNGGKLVDYGWKKVQEQPRTVGFQFIPLDAFTEVELQEAQVTFAVDTMHKVMEFDTRVIGDTAQKLVRTVK